MSERLSVTIPTELYQRLQPVKEQLNVSAICQQALDRAIGIEEIKKGDLPAMTKLTERLKLEKAESDEEWRLMGVESGRRHALEFTYDEFRILETTKEIDGYKLQQLMIAEINCLENPNEELFLEGWVEGVLSVWEDVREHLE